jgi:hypothetical protein
MLINLAGNALKFTHDGQVAVYARIAQAMQDGLLLEFTVSDTGIGIAELKQEKIFEAFSQADMSTTRRYGGTGLGLLICQRLVQPMGGRIWVESKEGLGSKFHFTIAVLREAEPELANRPPSRAMLPEGSRVLTVDDNAINRELLLRLLLRWNIKAWGQPAPAKCWLRSQTRSAPAKNSPRFCWRWTCPARGDWRWPSHCAHLPQPACR